MAKIHFYYGAMNASKTTLLINNADNYQRSGLKPIVIKPSIDTRENLEGVVVISRDADDIAGIDLQDHNALTSEVLQVLV